MKKRWKIIAIGFFALFVAIQFIRPAKNKSDKLPVYSIVNLYKISDTVQLLLKNACYDCHSNNTQYPWYAELQPFGWILARHIEKGKKELNFDEFGNYTVKRQKSKLKAIADQVRDREMPLRSYTWLHPDARIGIKENEMLINCTKHIIDNIQQRK